MAEPERDSDPIVGRTLGDFVVRKRIGAGGFGAVYLASQLRLEREAVVKVLHRRLRESPDATERFLREAKLATRLDHPYAAHVYAFGAEPEGLLWIAMELVRGTPLDQILRVRGPLPLAQFVPLLERMCEVVHNAHEHGIVHRDLKPANILIRLPDPRLQGATLDVRVADFNVGKVREEGLDISLTRVQGVPGTLFFQSPEQETNAFELLVNVQQGSMEVDYFEDFFMYISQNDTFQIFNRPERYPVAGADRAKKKLFLATPFQEPSETNVRAKIIKSVDRPADIYSIGAMFYYLASGAYGNPKTLYDAFHKFIEYEKLDEQNTVEAYIEHEYDVINSLRAPKREGEVPQVAPADRFFSYKHYLDGNGELIDKNVMLIVARAMIRNKPDSYCQAWDVTTTGISELVADLVRLYSDYGIDASARSAVLGRFVSVKRPPGPFARLWNKVARLDGAKPGKVPKEKRLKAPKPPKLPPGT
jgi:serine/threonine protein kinase